MNSLPPRRGRRRGSPDTRAEILSVARRRFLREGYQAVTLRSVAADAGVDLALVSYYFGSKKGLFGAAVSLSANPAELLAEAVAGDLQTLPVRALSALLAAWDDPVEGAPLRALVAGAAHDPAVTVLVKEVLEREVVAPLAARLGGRHAERRAAAFCAQVAGLLVLRYVLRVEPVASAPADEIVRQCAPALALALQPPGPRLPPYR
jgi:AcrR family transcriptional regulator